MGIYYRVESGRTLALIPAVTLFDCRTQKLEGGGVRLSFPGATADAGQIQNEPVKGGISGCRARCNASGVVIELIPAEGSSYAGLEQESDPPLYAAKFVAGPADLDPEARARLEAERRNWDLDLVVIDPGHGGQDPGAVGPSKVFEKDITLDVGKRLNEELKKRGLRTVMTRDRDVFIPLYERTKIANSSGGKLFISLHCNANPDRRAKGMETYFLAPAKNEKAMRVALRENSVIKYEESRDQYRDLTEENFILLQMAQANFARESQDMAGTLQTVVPAGMDMKSRGVDQAGFYVLIGASMPAVLFEMAFLSNPDEEKKLKSKNFRQQLAEQIADAVVKFLKEQNR
jgi:N-acetylmuramoyl-L-alanine amidase